MDKESFIDGLKEIYNGFTSTKARLIKEWIERENINNAQLDRLELLIVEEYPKTSFPLIHDLKTIYQNNYTNFAGKTEDIYYDTTFVNHVMRIEKLDLARIIKRYYAIEVKKFKQDKELNCYENYFLSIFDETVGNYRDRQSVCTIRENEIQTMNELEDLRAGKFVERVIIDARHKKTNLYKKEKETKTSYEIISNVFE